MQTYDWLMIIVLAATTVFGMWKGMAWQIASLASLVLSLFVGFRFADQFAPSLSGIAPPPLNKFLAILLIYMATSIVIWTLFRFVSGFIDRLKLEYFDRQMGAIFGFAKGILLCVAITFFAVSLLPPAQKEAILASNAGRYIVLGLDKTHSVVPPEMHDVIHPYVEKIEQRLDPNYQPHGDHDLPAWPGSGLPQWPTQVDTSDSTNQPPADWDSEPSWPTTENSSLPVWPESNSEATSPVWPSDPQTAERTRGAPY